MDVSLKINSAKKKIDKLGQPRKMDDQERSPARWCQIVHGEIYTLPI